MNFSEAVELLLPVVDSLYNSFQNRANEIIEHQSDAAITCKKGCGACCYFPVIPATGGEAFLVVARLLTQGYGFEDLQKMFLPYASRYFSFARSSGSLPFTDAQQRNFLQERLPCPLFVKEGSAQFSGHCSIFGFRPLICDFFHSTDSPELCAQKSKHGAIQSVMSLGDDAVEMLRNFERQQFGRSALGHLPLLLAALSTEVGLNNFLTVKNEMFENVTGEEQAEADFEFYCELLSCLGYDITVADLNALIRAQEEVQT